MGIDFNLEVVRTLRVPEMPVVLGDAADPESIAGLPLRGVPWAVAAVPEHETGLTHEDARLALVHALRFHGFDGWIAVPTQHAAEAKRLREAGADLVFLPFQDAADRAVNLMLGGGPPERALMAIEADEVRGEVAGASRRSEPSGSIPVHSA